MGKLTIEDPERIRIFLDNTTSLDWGSARESLSILKNEVFQLLYHEASYYYRIRQNKKMISGYLRIGMLFFGTLGVLAPLAEAANLSDAGSYGYLFLAISGAFLTADKLFGGSSSHARMVTTQLQLEKIIAVGTMKWNELERKLNQSGEESPEIEAQMFQLTVETLENAYKLIIDETNEWSESLKTAITDFENRYKHSQKEKI